MKLWQKNYQLDKEIEEFTVGNDFIIDKKLIKYDCLASIAHTKMLGNCNILKKQEVQKLVKELNNIIKLDKQGGFSIDQSDEDCHTTIENHLVKKLGDVGKKIHTARSRNDQVLVALRLYYKNELLECKKEVNNLVSSIIKFNKKFGNIEIPGFTHTRKAMPSSIDLWSNAFVDSMKDNLKLIDLSLDLINQSPLGTGAGYNTSLNIDRDFTAKLLGFEKVQKNAIYVQNSRGKFESTILHSLSQVMFDLNRIASDLIIFTMPEFNYFDLPQEFCTGSSIMPHKKNPDVLELIRAKYHVVNSYEFQVKSMTSNLMSGYHRDLQLTKEPIINGLEITNQSLTIMSMVFKELEVNKDSCIKSMTEELYSTDEVYKLVKEGVSFREAYKLISKKY